MRSPRSLVALLFVVPLLSGCLGGKASDWAYDMTGIRTAQDRGLSGRGITVAIVDTGFNPQHPSLDHTQVVAWRDYVSNRPAPYDDVGHGSHVAGIIVGEGGSFGAKWQGFNLEGAAPKARLIIVKAIGADGTGDSADVADGIRFSTQQGADVICLSLGSRANPLNFIGDEITNSVNSAIDQGILVVAAAGNTGEEGDRDDVETPSTIEGVIAVGAVDEKKRLASFTAEGNDFQNHGPLSNDVGAPRKDPNKKPELVAPGVDIKSAWKGKDYAVAKGTSQAAPFVCGALALLLESKPNLRGVNSRGLTDQVKSGLLQSAEKIGGQRTPHDNRAGYGLVRADRLLTQL